MKPAICIDAVGKRYQVNHEERRDNYRTLRESLAAAVAAPFRRWARRSAAARPRDFWALRDVNLEIQAGDVIGIIGRNGAGKSTLLKIVSRITTPTLGTVTIRGRIGCLLEVGTGFHPELTGRENIFLNGSILGMTRREIIRRFDEIVAFAEVEEFLDLPVKRYSSGMYVRLAFAVAAHLEPEILITDEVLAVGDAAFQRRCLQKMGEVSRSGRTVLFVSHNLGSIRSLCRNAVVLERGRVIGYGPTDAQVANYLSRLTESAKESLANRLDRSGNGKGRITSVRFVDAFGNSVDHVCSGDLVTIVVGYETDHAGAQAHMGFSCWNAEGQVLFHADTWLRSTMLPRLSRSGEYACTLPRVPLTPGTYHLNLGILIDGAMADQVQSAATLDVLPGDYYGNIRPDHHARGLVFVDHEWR